MRYIIILGSFRESCNVIQRNMHAEINLISDEDPRFIVRNCDTCNASDLIISKFSLPAHHSACLLSQISTTLTTLAASFASDPVDTRCKLQTSINQVSASAEREREREKERRE